MNVSFMRLGRAFFLYGSVRSQELTVPFLLAKSERLRRGLTQEQVATLTHLPQSTISAIERGRVNPSSAEVEALGRAFGVSPASVLLKPVEFHNPADVEPQRG
jgi:transcriptional regulator with XRE-family HTH domain